MALKLVVVRLIARPRATASVISACPTAELPMADVAKAMAIASAATVFAGFVSRKVSVRSSARAAHSMTTVARVSAMEISARYV